MTDLTTALAGVVDSEPGKTHLVVPRALLVDLLAHVRRLGEERDTAAKGLDMERQWTRALRSDGETLLQENDALRTTVDRALQDVARRLADLEAATARGEGERAQHEAAFQLAADDQIMFFRRGEQVFPAILVNDTFYYACADAETVDWSVMPELLDEYRTQGWPIVVERVATMRNLRPLPDVERAMERARDAQQRVESERDALAAEVGKLKAERDDWREKYEFLARAITPRPKDAR